MTIFDISGKVAIVTGGASGLGYNFVGQLLEKGAKGVTIADVSEENGVKVSQEFEQKYSKGKVVFVKADVSSYEEFENVFKLTVEKFGNIDILINNAGIFNDANWSKEVDINLKSTIHGTILALENYIYKHKSGSEGVVVNMSSVTGVEALAGLPIYSATKFGVHGLTLALGHPVHYERTGVKVVGICPGFTRTPILQTFVAGAISQSYIDIIRNATTEIGEMQSPEHVAVNLIKIIEKAPPGTIWVVEHGEPPFRYDLPKRYKILKSFCNHRLNVQEAVITQLICFYILISNYLWVNCFWS